MAKRLYILPELCTGCNRCVYVCSAVKENVFIPSKARIRVIGYSLKGRSVPVVCYQCDVPKCVEVCPVEALGKNSEGIVVVDSEKCVGCGECVSACPYGMIDVVGEIAVKCDLCGGDPTCVKECYPGALVYKE